jgi:hypothetical protein
VAGRVPGRGDDLRVGLQPSRSPSATSRSGTTGDATGTVGLIAPNSGISQSASTGDAPRDRHGTRSSRRVRRSPARRPAQPARQASRCDPRGRG